MNRNPQMERDLLERAQQIDKRALAEIYDLHSPALYRYAFRLLGDAMLAEDCVAETFTRFLKALQAGQGPRDFLQAYLYRTAHNWITDQYRRQPVIEALDDTVLSSADSPEEQTRSRFRQTQLRTMIQKLTPEQQQVIALKYFEEWDNEEIARAMHKPVGAIKSLQHRALARLQGFLDEEGIQ